MDPRFKTSEPIILYTRRKKKKMSSCNVEALTMERFTAHCPFIFLLFIIQMEGRTRRRDRKGRKVLREGDVSENPRTDWKRSCAWLLHTNIKNQGKGMLGQDTEDT